MRERLANEIIQSREHSDAAETLTILEGQLRVEMVGEMVVLSTGDTAVIPSNTPYKYWSEVALTRIYIGAANLQAEAEKGDTVFSGLTGDLIRESEPWDWAVWPSS